MDYPVDGIHWADIAHSRIILAKPADGKDPQPFRIYRIGKPLNGKCHIYARHISYQLSHIPVLPFTANSFSAALSGLVAHAAEDCPFTVWTDKTTTGDFEVKVPTSFRSLLGGTSNSLLDRFGTAEYEFDNYVVKAHLNRGVNRGVVLRYGKNITDLKQEENIENTITGICPYWVESGTGRCKTLPEKALWSSRANNFPYKRTIPVDFSLDFEEEPTDEELRAAGNAYISDNNIGIPEVSIELAFVPLWQTEEYKNIANIERVNLCDTITVEFEKLSVSTQAKVVKTVYDVLRERYHSIGVGSAKSTLAKTITRKTDTTRDQVKTTQSVLEGYIQYITEKIVGGKGGYVLLNYNSDGYPEEILIMDSPSESTATKIMRFNMSGIAFSTDGGATYRTGWTIDGVFNASFIGTGVLDATLIRAGLLQDVAGKNSWDMVSGALTMASGSINIADKFVVDANGNMKATAGEFTGAIKGGSININNKFIVDAQGNLTATSGTFSGNVYAKNIQYGGDYGTFHGSGITGSTVTTTQTAAGINTSLGYANFANSVFSNIETAEYVGANWITAHNSVYAPTYYVNLGGDSEGTVNAHTHYIEEENGVVTIGRPDFTGHDHSFNIADTQFYKDGVSARNATSASYETEEGGAAVWDKIWVRSSDGHVVGNLSLTYGGKSGYQNGVDSVTIPSNSASYIWSGGQQGGIWENDYGSHYITIRANAKATNGKSGYRDIDVNVEGVFTEARKGYTKGTFTAVKVTPIGQQRYRYALGSYVSGWTVSKCNTAYYYDSDTGKYVKLDNVYYLGEQISGYLIGTGGSYYEAGTETTYYSKS
ncbi:MAG: phage tail protein [Clostridia bacterium]|nr:phage tail protein [Clostridia bacterium]